jgi:NADPH:quinone reductase-like Zn-dependent oxidoreductase
MATQRKTMMQAIAIDSYGGLNKLQLRDLPMPEPQTGEVRIHVRAAGVGIWDAQQRRGAFPPEHERFPMVVGAECSGTIDAIGAGVDQPLHEGDEVYSYFYGDQGAYAEFVCVKADDVALKPKNLSFVEAAAIPVDGITAHQALVDELHVASGEIVLIAGASGGVGTLAVQIAAKLLRAHVIATAGKGNLDYVRSLGAADAIDYTAGHVVEGVKTFALTGVDAALDCVGKAGNAKMTIAAVRDGGRLAELIGEDVPAERGITIAHIQSAPSAKRLDTLRALFEDGTLHVEIAETFPLAAARSAQEAIETRHTRGKIVLVVN